MTMSQSIIIKQISLQRSPSNNRARENSARKLGSHWVLRHIQNAVNHLRCPILDFWENSEYGEEKSSHFSHEVTQGVAFFVMISNFFFVFKWGYHKADFYGLRKKLPEIYRRRVRVLELHIFSLHYSYFLGEVKCS